MDETAKPVIIDFKSEYDKWMVLRYKADFRETEEYKSFFYITGFVERGKRGKREEERYITREESRMGDERRKRSERENRRKGKSTVKVE